MAIRLRLSRIRLRSLLRRLVWWVWPASPSSWSEVPSRLRPAITSVSRLTIAAVVAYLVANLLSPGIVDLTAPLTALLVVQASTVGTLRMGLVRVGAVLTGVLVAVAVASFLGLTWWTLAAVIVTSLVLAKVLRLGEQSLEAPISAMLILAVASPSLAAEVRVFNTLIGTVVGIGFSLVVPTAIPNARAAESVRRVARAQAALMDEVALTLGGRPPLPEEVQAWFDWTEQIATDIDAAAIAVQLVIDSRVLNPRALAAAAVHPRLRAGLDRLERCLAAERALLVLIAKDAPTAGAAAQPGSGAELRRAFAVVLDDLANGLRAFGELVGGSYGTREVGGRDESLVRTLDIVRETRAVLTEITLLNVDARHDTDLWLLQGSVLTAIDQILTQLDVQNGEFAPTTAPAVPFNAAMVTAASFSAASFSAASRSLRDLAREAGHLLEWPDDRPR